MRPLRTMNVRRRSCSTLRSALLRQRDLNVKAKSDRHLTQGQQHMFTHVMVGAHDLDASKKFYDTVLGALGLPAGQPDPKGRIFYRTKTGVFGITKPIDGHPATHANGGTISFACPSPELARAFHDAGVATGGKSIEDPPGWREGATGRFYLAYLRDPSGNKI